jgi:hypothetical protein
MLALFARRRWLVVLLTMAMGRVASAAESCQFRFVPARIGEVSCQELDFLIDLKLTISHDGRELYKSVKSVERVQTRWTQVLAMQQDVVTQVAVRFDVAKETQISDNRPAEPVDEPVARRTYTITRSGQDLLVSSSDGNTPSQEEAEYLARAMDTVGRPNALGRFLQGREFVRGKSIDVPPEIAREIFGFRDAVGEVASLTLALSETHATTRGNYALLDAKMTARSPEEPHMAMRIEGQMQLDIDTCRVVGFVWEGPVTLSDKRGDGAEAMMLSGAGSLAVEMRSKRAAAWPAPLKANDYASSPSSSRK